MTCRVRGCGIVGNTGLVVGDAATEVELFRRLREGAERVWPQYEEWYGPLLDEEIAESEELLGFTLPPFVRRVYTQVGNGGFGPGYGGVLGRHDT